jgi:hypothetical protein
MLIDMPSRFSAQAVCIDSSQVATIARIEYRTAGLPDRRGSTRRSVVETSMDWIAVVWCADGNWNCPN